MAGLVVYATHPWRVVGDMLDVVYYALQFFIIWLFAPHPPSDELLSRPKGRIAVVGAGLTGVSSAAHCVAHGFEVVLFEQKGSVGGIWADVNVTSGLQLNSLLYRFHPAVHWKHAFPHRDEILSEIRRIWRKYKLEPRTRLNTAVTSITRADGSTSPADGGHARWVVNGNNDEVFDAVIVTVGTCGAPREIHFPGTDRFSGKLLHSSELDDAELEGKKVVVVGGGASGVEAVELAINKGAQNCTIVAREDKWVIPRNIVFDTLISMQPFGREMPLSFVPEWLLKTFHYRSVQNIAPTDKGLFEGTPVVNDDFLEHVRKQRCRYMRGDGKTLTEKGVLVSVRAAQEAKDSGNRSPTPEGQKHSGDTADEEEEELLADVVVLATGFERPSVDFLPADLFPEDYSRPNLYVNGIGTVGHFHIGIYTRVLLALLLDPAARPTPRDMKLWVDAMELMVWLFLFHVFRPDRFRWMFFILNGWGTSARAA